MIGWRVPAIALLLGFTMRESQVLGVDLAKYRALGAGQEVYCVSAMLVPICAILTIIGVALGMGAGMSLPRASPARARPYWLFVPLAALAAVLFMGQPGGECTLIPQFILVVLDFVIDAMPPPGVRLPGSLAVRLLRAGIEAVPAALACLWLALVVAHDFERARRDQPWAMGRGGWICVSSRSSSRSRPGPSSSGWRSRRCTPACSTASESSSIPSPSRWCSAASASSRPAWRPGRSCRHRATRRRASSAGSHASSRPA